MDSFSTEEEKNGEILSVFMLQFILHWAFPNVVAQRTYKR